jgi:hypothetical protein
MAILMLERLIQKAFFRMRVIGFREMEFPESASFDQLQTIIVRHIR